MKGNDGKWSKNTNQQEFKFANLYDLGFFADKLAYSSFAFDETSGTYKCASLNTTIYETPYLIENIEIAFENNKVKSISNKVSSQNPEVPGSSTVSVVFTNHGTTTVTLPEVQEEPTSKELSDIFLDVGTETIYLAASKERPAKSSLYTEVTGASQRQNLLQTPGVLLYLVGKLYENEGFDCLDKLVRFRCAYDVQVGPGQTMVLDNKLDLMIHIDKEEGQILFYGYQDSLQTIGTNTTPVVSPIYMEIEYDFENDEMGDFKFWEITGSETPSTVYCEYIDGVLKTLDYNHRNDDGDYAKESAVIEAAVALMTEKRATMTEADAATARLYGEGFVATQAYASEVFGHTIPMTIHED